MFLSALLFFFASPFYVKQKPSKSLFTGFIQVPVVAYKNRKLAFPPRDSDGWYHHKRDSKFIAPTTKLRYNHVIILLISLSFLLMNEAFTIL
jgi:peptide/histidine transporter 3/4